MSEETIALALGSLFLLIAIVGGGFTIQRAQRPRVPAWARIVSSVIGVALIGFFGYSTLSQDSGARPVGSDEAGVVEQPTDGIHLDAGPHLAPQGIELSGLVARWDDPLVINDTIALSYRLRNTGDAPVQLEYTFVGVRDPAGTNRDKEVDPPLTLQPGDRIDVQTTLLLDEGGVWRFWPCFDVVGGAECPDEWRSFALAVARE